MGPSARWTIPLSTTTIGSVAHFKDKQERYLRYDARMLFDKGTVPKFRNFILQPLRQFHLRYVTLKGYRDCWHGLRLSLFMAWYEYRKYRHLAELHASKRP